MGARATKELLRQLMVEIAEGSAGTHTDTFHRACDMLGVDLTAEGFVARAIAEPRPASMNELTERAAAMARKHGNEELAKDIEAMHPKPPAVEAVEALAESGETP